MPLRVLPRTPTAAGRRPGREHGSVQPDLRSVRSGLAKRACLVWESFGAASKYGADLRLDTKVDQGRMNPTVGLDQPAAHSASHSFPYGATLEYESGHVFIVSGQQMASRSRNS
jgi:hypothetical protein